MPIEKTKTLSRPTKQIHIRPKTYKLLKHDAVDMEVPLLHLTEQIIEAGRKVVLGDRSSQPPISN